MTLSAVVIAIVYAADQGGTYARGIAVGLAFLLGVIVLSVVTFLLAWSIGHFPRLVGVAVIVLGVQLWLLRWNAMLFGSSLQPGDAAWLLAALCVGLWLLLGPLANRRGRQPDSPFAEDQLPPQIYAPRDPVN